MSSDISYKVLYAESPEALSKIVDVHIAALGYRLYGNINFLNNLWVQVVVL